MMTVRIIEAAENKDEILSFEYTVHCPHCGEKQFSPFDKLYTYSYGKCVDCSTVDELERLGENVFAIL